MPPPLQPLRIPPGWLVGYNDFREVDPSPEAMADDLLREDLLREDLLQLRLSEPPRVVDLGWYGPLEDGAFGVVCVEPDFRGQTLDRVRTRDRMAAVAAVELFLQRHGHR